MVPSTLNFIKYARTYRKHIMAVKTPQKEAENNFQHGWANPPTLADLKSDLESTNATHSAHAAQVKAWIAELRPDSDKQKDGKTTNSSPFAAQYNVNKNKTRSTVKSKLIRKQAEWRYTSLSEPFLSTPDVFNVDPARKSDVAAAVQNGLVLNNQINTQLDKVAFFDEYVRACVDEGTVIVKTGWDYQVNKVKVEYPVFEILPATDNTQIEILQGISQGDPSELEPELAEALRISKETGVPHFPVQTGTEEVEEEEVIRNQPTWEVCHYENVRADPTCNGRIEDAEFIIYSFESNKSTLEKTGLYSNLDKIVSSSVNSEGDHESKWGESGFEFQDDPRKKFVVYEYWGYWDIDGSGKTRPFLASWVGDTLIRLEDSPYPDGELPFVSVPFMPLKDSIYGEPDGELLKDNQAISGAITRGMIDLFGHSANAQIGFRKGALDAVNKRKFERGQHYEYNDVGDAQQSIYMHQFPEIPQSAYNFLSMQNQEADALTGVKSFSEGISGAGLGDTAAAANGALSAAARRELGILRRLAEGVKKIGRKFIAMNQEFLSEEETVRITEEEFVTFSRDDLAGKFDLRLSISTAEADEQKAKELSFMLQTTAQSMGMEFTKLIQAEIADLRKMPYLADQIRKFEPKPDPMAIKEKELELALKQADIEKTMAETQKILAEAQFSGYKAANTQADTDKKNLEYVEQAEGVSHARDLDKMGEQSKAQAQTKLVDAALKAATDNKEPKQ